MDTGLVRLIQHVDNVNKPSDKFITVLKCFIYELLYMLLDLSIDVASAANRVTILREDVAIASNRVVKSIHYHRCKSRTQSNCLEMPKSLFDRMTKKIGFSLDDTILLRKESIRYIQTIIESALFALIKEAHVIANRSNRSMTVNDLHIAKLTFTQGR